MSFSDLPSGTYRFTLASCAWVYEMGIAYFYQCTLLPSTEKVVTVTRNAEPAIDSLTTAAGSTAYAARVGRRGAAEIDVAIRAPAGENGLSLDLGLRYDGARGSDRARYVVDDSLGYGWSLQGVPAVHRCTVGLASYPELPQLGADDRLCLDGESL